MQKGRQLINGVYEETVKYRDHYFDLEPSLRLAFGFSWTHDFPKRQGSFAISAGYETNYWWDQYHIFALAPTNDIPSLLTKSVSLKGAYLRIEGNF